MFVVEIFHWSTVRNIKLNIHFFPNKTFTNMAYLIENHGVSKYSFD